MLLLTAFLAQVITYGLVLRYITLGHPLPPSHEINETIHSEGFISGVFGGPLTPRLASYAVAFLICILAGKPMMVLACILAELVLNIGMWFVVIRK